MVVTGIPTHVRIKGGKEKHITTGPLPTGRDQGFQQMEATGLQSEQTPLPGTTTQERCLPGPRPEATLLQYSVLPAAGATLLQYSVPPAAVATLLRYSVPPAAEATILPCSDPAAVTAERAVPP